MFNTRISESPPQSAINLAKEAYAENNESEAIKYFLIADKENNADARFCLGLMAEDAGHLVSAAKWYELAVAQNQPFAQYNLARMLKRGLGVTQDQDRAADLYREAAKWFKPAAEKGLAAAQYKYAIMLHRGNGVEKNETAAREWFTLAAEQGYTKAIHILKKFKIKEDLRGQTLFINQLQKKLSAENPLLGVLIESHAHGSKP